MVDMIGPYPGISDAAPLSMPPGPGSSGGSDMDVLGLINALKTDEEKYNELAKKAGEAGRPNVKGRLLGAGALVLLSLLGGRKGRAGMGEALSGFNQAYSMGDRERMDSAKAELAPQLKGLSDKASGNRDIMKEIILANMKKKAGVGDYGTADTKNYAFAKSQGFPGSFEDWVDRNRPGSTPTTEERNYRLYQGDPEFARWYDNHKADPYVNAAAALVANDLSLLRAPTEQKIKAILDTAAGLKNNNTQQNTQPSGAQTGLGKVPTFN